MSDKVKICKVSDAAPNTYTVTVGERLIGTVVKKQTSKTGFRRNKCVGQVRCERWFGYTEPGKVHLPQNNPRFGTPGYQARCLVVDEILKAAGFTVVKPKE